MRAPWRATIFLLLLLLCACNCFLVVLRKTRTAFLDFILFLFQSTFSLLLLLFLCFRARSRPLKVWLSVINDLFEGASRVTPFVLVLVVAAEQEKVIKCLARLSGESLPSNIHSARAIPPQTDQWHALICLFVCLFVLCVPARSTGLAGSCAVLHEINNRSAPLVSAHCSAKRTSLPIVLCRVVTRSQN